MNARLRVAYLLSQYPAINHTYLFNEISHLRDLGLEIHVASVLPPDRPSEKLTPGEREEACRTFCVKRAGLRGAAAAHLATLLSRPLRYLEGLRKAVALGGSDARSLLRWLFYFAEAVVVGRWMLARGLSHLHVHYASNVGLLVPRIFPVTVSQTMHGPAEFEDPEGFKLAGKISASLFVRAISNYGRSRLMCAADPAEWPKLEVARLGVDTSLFQPAEVRENPRPCEIVCVGRLSPEKGQHVLLAAMECLIAEDRDVRLRLVGDGPGRAALERHAADRGLAARVVFEGWASPERVRGLYSQADICAMPSFSEGIPVALMEAMAVGLACVATRITGIPELIEDGVHGLLVTPSDEAELARAIVRLMNDAPLRRQLGEAARRRVLADYDFARNAAILAEIFRRRLSAAT